MRASPLFPSRSLSLSLDTADVLDLAEAAQDLVEAHTGIGDGGAGTPSDERIDQAALDAPLSGIMAALQIAEAERERAADMRRRAPHALPHAEVDPATVERGESLQREGGDGELYRGTLHGATAVALRVFCGYCEREADELRREADELRREVGVQMALASPHVVQVYGAITHEPAQLCVVLERAPHDSLLDAMRASAGEPPPPAELARCALHVTAGVAHLHSRRLSHGDLKSANVLRCADGVWKICDFGLARAKRASRASRGAVGTRAWKAPELLDAARSRGAMADKADCYALGCVFFELLAWRTPWEGTAEAAILDAMREGERPRLPDEWAQAELRPLETEMRALWHAEPDERPPVDLALVARVRLCEAAAREAAERAAERVAAEAAKREAKRVAAERVAAERLATERLAAEAVARLAAERLAAEAEARVAAAHAARARELTVNTEAENALLELLGRSFRKTRAQLLLARECDLPNMGIGRSREGVQAVAVLLKRSRALIRLNLNGNGLCAEGARILAEGLEGNTTLTTLDLGNNQIGDSGAAALAKVLPSATGLTELILHSNQIGNAAQGQLNAVRGWSRFHNLKLVFNV